MDSQTIDSFPIFLLGGPIGLHSVSWVYEDYKRVPDVFHKFKITRITGCQLF
jgi:hypothetical protein